MRMKKFGIWKVWFLLILVIIILVAISLFKEEKFTIIIDPGHGGNLYPGPVEGKLHEADINLDISLLLADILKRKGYLVVLTRKNDASVSLKKRVEIANKYGNKKSSLFVSIHQNYCDNCSLDRIEAHLDVLSDTLKEDEVFAKAILSSFIKLELSNDPVTFKPALVVSDAYVLLNKKIPGILLEVNYLSNPIYWEWISEEKNKLLIAQTIVEGIDLYAKKCRKNTKECNFLPDFPFIVFKSYYIQE